jgi:hypothetical protein
MARHRIFYLLAAVLGLALVIALVQQSARGTDSDFSFDAAKLKDATVWTKVNAKPYRISAFVDSLCAAPTARDYESERKKNPHAGAFITVYVNNTGREAMFAKETQTFPQGSVIVKEKIGNEIEGGKPVLYTIMRKREAGFNPVLGDWEFAVVGANGKELQAIGKLDNCQSCHKDKRDSDFVYRSYLGSN